MQAVAGWSATKRKFAHLLSPRWAPSHLQAPGAMPGAFFLAWVVGAWDCHLHGFLHAMGMAFQFLNLTNTAGDWPLRLQGVYFARVPIPMRVGVPQAHMKQCYGVVALDTLN